jgi:endonuclease/exonuclease/phosphatase family metal-dependent hydrolase
MLESTYRYEIEREPFIIDFIHGKDTFSLASIHAVPKSKQPERELKYLKFLPGIYPDRVLMIMGDFNCPQSHSVFSPLKSSGYKPALTGQKTTLKRNCRTRDCLSSEYDNIFYPLREIAMVKSGVIHFQEKTPIYLLPEAISDHLPVFLYFSVK